MEEYKKKIHDKYAPFWAAAIIIIGLTGLSTIWIDLGDFWKGYVLDIAGPAWNYILFRGLYTSYSNNAWRRFFNPLRTYLIFVLVCTGIELAQFYNLYDATYDPLDFLAYVSVLTPLFFLDILQSRKIRNFDD